MLGSNVIGKSKNHYYDDMIKEVNVNSYQNLYLLYIPKHDDQV